ncbi:hypothetical protein XA68_14780 [Ophiocordyceps unilateralis]|uniref:Uncharacterized protein n=1 Tax=Ophiocordyceps unilateralis TaxID=268505 RepID=A0A2A9P9M2_OPHUN|nr:hypothetical protein XA68_14780 [Ophiocordyceps unilateralis]
MKTALICLSGLAAAHAAGEQYGIVTLSLVPRYSVAGAVPESGRSGPVPRAIGDGTCRQGSHNCLDVGHADQCCDNDSYCYVNRNREPRCCPVGSNCIDDSPCKSDSFYCRQPAARSALDGCCGRLCPQTSHYLCPQSLGGRCCPYGAECQAGGNCLQTKTTMTTSSWPMPSPTAADSGCTSRQTRCADGTGCCSHDQQCTRVSQTAFCASSSPSDRGLSRGTLVGIGVGAAAAMGVMTAAAAWLCFYSRRRRQDDGKDKDATALSTLSPRLRPLTGDYSGPNPVSGPYTETAVPSATRLLGGLPRAVPTRPHGPGDIAAPVEMESSSVVGRRRSGVDNDSPPLKSPQAAQPTDTTEGRFELYGCEAYKLPHVAFYHVPDTPPSCRSTDESDSTR